MQEDVNRGVHFNFNFYLFSGDLQSFEINSCCFTGVQEIKTWKRDEAASHNFVFCFHAPALLKCSNSLLHLSPYAMVAFFFAAASRLSLSIWCIWCLRPFLFFCFFLHASPWVTKTKHLPRGRCNSQLPAVSDSSPPICSFQLSNSRNPSSFVPELSKALRSLVTIFNLRECSLPRVISKSLSVLINWLRFEQRKLTRLQRRRTLWCTFYFISF